MRFIVLFLGLSILMSLKPVEAGQFETSITLGPEHFQWKEFDESGQTLLTESGTRTRASVFFGNVWDPSSRLLFRVGGDIYVGTVDYDGQTQSGIEAHSDTDYVGYRIEGMLGFTTHPKNQFSWEVFGAVSVGEWSRDINDGYDINGNRVYGYEENYFVWELKAATGPRWQIGRWRAQALVGIKQPLYVVETLPEGFDETLYLYPEPRTSLFAVFENTFRIRDRLSLALRVYYDSYRFDKSDDELTTSGGVPYFVWQPESHMDVYGVQVGVSF